MTRLVYLTLSIVLATSNAWGAVKLMGSNGRDWTVGQYTDDYSRKKQCLMRWDSAGRTFTYALFKDGAVMSFRRDTWKLPEITGDTSVTLDGTAVQAQRLDDHTLGIGWGEKPSPLPTLQFNAFIQSGQDMIVGFDNDESAWIVSFPTSTSISDGWLKCLSDLDKS